MVAVAVYMMIPETMAYMRLNAFTPAQQAAVMGVYALGIFVFGPMVNGFVERYRRKKVCLVALLFLMADMGVMSYLRSTAMAPDFYVLLALRAVLGATSGLAQMVLLSTLVVDAVQSFFRTEANHHINWFGRFAVAVGPLVSLCAVSYESLEWAFTLSAVLVLIAFLLISVVKFPFKSPADGVRTFSLDRFFLASGTRLFVNLMLITMMLGMLYTLALTMSFYVWMLVGLLVAVVIERVVFANAELKSQAVAGHLCVTAALLILLTQSRLDEVTPVAASLLGIGVGLLGSRFLMFFIKLSSHCQRGTSQSTYFLAWESGVGLGLGIGLCAFSGSPRLLLLGALAVTLCSGILYTGYTHGWYVHHKNR